MAVTKILARKGRLDVGVRYVLNGDKTQEQVLTTRLNCEPGREVRQMLETKRDYGKEDGIQYYHMIQSFRPGEITPELALEIAKEFASEHLPGYQTVIGVHVDKEHIHAHILFNSVNADTGQKYHSNTQSYYRQIRVISDRLCREHGLSVIMQGEPSKAVSYIEWLRQSKGQAPFRSMLESDLQEAIQDANDLGHFFLLMEHKGYEIKHGTRLGFRLRGQERFMIPSRKNPMFTEEGIRAAIQGNLSAIEAGARPAVLPRPSYRPYTPRPKYKGFLALYVHYLYLCRYVCCKGAPSKAGPMLNFTRLVWAGQAADGASLISLKQRMSDISAEQALLLDKVLENMDDPDLNAQLKALMDEKQAVQEQIQTMEQETFQSENRMSRMAELREWMAQLEVNPEYNDEQVRMAVEQITAVDAETIHIKFRYPGLEMDKKLN